MKEIKRIGIDMDGVIFNFVKKFAERYTETHPDNPITEEDLVGEWNLNNVEKLVYKPYKAIYDTPGFYAGIEPYPGMAEFFKWLYTNYEVYVISTAPHERLHEKTEAMLKICPWFNDWDIIFTNRKDLVNVDVLIDDAPHNLVAAGDRALAYTKDYNTDIVTPYRCSDPEELKQWIIKNCVPRKEKICTHVQ